MEFQVVAELLKIVPEGFSSILIIGFIAYTIYTKTKATDLNQVTEVGKLQSTQLSTLIDQNMKLAEELHSVRTELSAAYDIINDMRNKIVELEEIVQLLKKKGE